jgi:hypothetical protein
VQNLMTKDEILDALEDNREKLLEALDDLEEQEYVEPCVIGGWSVKDILAHLVRWEAELVKLLWSISQGLNPPTLISSAQENEVNARWKKEDEQRPLELILNDLRSVRKQTSRRVAALSEAELNNPQRYPYLHGIPLCEWIAGESFRHEAEHTAQILQWKAMRHSSPSLKADD